MALHSGWRLVIRAALSHLARLGRAGFVLAREGVFALVDPAPLPLPARTALALARLIERPTAATAPSRLAAALTRLGPTYVKLGQFLATRPDVVGVALARDLESAAGQDGAVPASARRKPRSRPRSASRWRRSSRSFGPPVAAASIAQVHRAEVDDAGRPQAGRGQGAAARHRAALPRRSRRLHLRRAQRPRACRPEARRLRLIEAVATLRRSVAIEMDLRLEAAALSEMAENTKDDPDFRVPAVDWDRTARDVLTLEWIDGTPLPTAPRSRPRASTCRRSAAR